MCGARLSQQWSGACLGSPWKVVDPTLLGLFDKCHGAPVPRGGFTQEPVGGTWLFCLTLLLASVEFLQDPVCRWSHSADTAVPIICADILGVSPCQMCLL